MPGLTRTTCQVVLLSYLVLTNFQRSSHCLPCQPRPRRSKRFSVNCWSKTREPSASRINDELITKVKDARAFTNLAINQINAGKHAEAIALLTRLIAQFPDDKPLLYYRGRAYIVATKLPEAKADLEAFVAAAPTATQAADAKRLLEQLNKKL